MSKLALYAIAGGVALVLLLGLGTWAGNLLRVGATTEALDRVEQQAETMGNDADNARNTFEWCVDHGLRWDWGRQVCAK